MCQCEFRDYEKVISLTPLAPGAITDNRFHWNVGGLESQRTAYAAALRRATKGIQTTPRDCHRRRVRANGEDLISGYAQFCIKLYSLSW